MQCKGYIPTEVGDCGFESRHSSLSYCGPVSLMKPFRALRSWALQSSSDSIMIDTIETEYWHELFFPVHLDNDPRLTRLSALERRRFTNTLEDEEEYWSLFEELATESLYLKWLLLKAKL